MLYNKCVPYASRRKVFAGWSFHLIGFLKFPTTLSSTVDEATFLDVISPKLLFFATSSFSFEAVDMLSINQSINFIMAQQAGFQTCCVRITKYKC